MDQPVFAHVIDGVIKEFPLDQAGPQVYPHDWYAPCIYEGKFQPQEFYVLVEKLVIFGQNVHVRYTEQPLGLESLMGRLPSAANPDADFPTPNLMRRIQQLTIDRIQQRLDDFAKTRGYDGIVSGATYATSPNVKFSAEGQYCVEARDATWSALYVFNDKVSKGEVPLPTRYIEIEAALPALVWPD